MRLRGLWTLLTGIHCNEGQGIFRLLFTIQCSQQRDLARRSVYSEEIGIALLEEVAHLVVKWRRIGIERLHRDHIAAIRYHILHDVSEIWRVEEGGKAVVYVGDGYNQLGSIEPRFATANIAGTIFRTNRQHVARFALVVEILGNSYDASILANAEITIIVAAGYWEANASVGTLIDVGCGNLTKI